jgi:signal transduction histidine kinase
MEQVFCNIFDNSLTAGSDFVVIEIACSTTNLDRQPALQIAARDYGPGIEPDKRAKIFEPFFTTKAKGTGLGMAIAKRIVEAHGGRITVGDADGSGAVILITLPKGLS